MLRNGRLMVATMACAAVLGSGFTGAAATAAVPVRAAACGTPLDAGAIATITELSDVDTVTGDDPLQRLEEVVSRNQQIAETLVAHGDRRGLFALMEDIAGRGTVLPMIRSAAGLTDPQFDARFVVEYLDTWLRAVHAEFTGAPVPPHWERYFDLAADCSASDAYAAMVGYNAHMSVDIPWALAESGVGTDNSADYFRFLDGIAVNNAVLVQRTKDTYNADVGPLWRFYFFGDGLDLITGPGVGSGQLLRTALFGVNAANLANGLGLQNPATRGVTDAGIDAMWAAVDTALGALTQVHGL
ncbi:DUF5995 family protein [Nocardia crassostreae]|uniref:DUF5995 family protein n=1 Tax=Nocardia crassostreae TaxID=53428 RepID=UPI0008323902|nr:DUF5995 family protein [Nocardia crassostreae]